MQNKNMTTKNTQPNPLKRLVEQMFKAKGRKLLKAIKWQTELWTNPLYSTAKKIVMAAGTSGGKSLALSGKLELEKLLRNMDFYYRKESKNRKKTLICPSGTNVLKDNMVDTFIKFNPSFTYKVVSDRNDLIEAVNGDYDVIIALPQICMSNIDLLPKVDLFVLDEAHTWYFAKKGKGSIHEIIEKTQPTQEILLTGTPFRFQTAERKNKFTFIYVTVFDLMDEGLVSKPKVEIVSTPSYNFTNKNYQGNFGNLKSGQTKSKNKNRGSLEDVLFDMVTKLYYNNDNTILKNRKNLGVISKLWNDAGKMLNDMYKTILFCDSREQADEFGRILNEREELKNKVLVSHSDNDKLSENFVKFQQDPDIKILIAVDRGRLGYNVEELFNVVDFTFTQNLAMLMQMFGRLLRLSENQPGKRKIYYKVATAETAEYFATLMLGMFHLFHIDWYERFDGKNMGQIRVPQIRGKGKGKGGATTGGNKRKPGIRPTVNIDDLDLLDIDVYRNFLHKNDDLFTTIKSTTLDEVRREFYNIQAPHHDGTKKDCLPSSDAMKFVHSLKLKSLSEWDAFTKSDKMPDNIPVGFSGYYKKSEGIDISVAEWIGYYNPMSSNKSFVSYLECKEWFAKNNITTQGQFRKYCNENTKPEYIPSNPNKYYEEWNGWGEFTGSGNNNGGLSIYKPFKEVRKFIRSLKFKNKSEYSNWLKSNKPKDIPTHPDSCKQYKTEWTDWEDYLGCKILRTNNMKLSDKEKIKICNLYKKLLKQNDGNSRGICVSILNEFYNETDITINQIRKCVQHLQSKVRNTPYTKADIPELKRKLKKIKGMKEARATIGGTAYNFLKELGIIKKLFPHRIVGNQFGLKVAKK